MDVDFVFDTSQYKLKVSERSFCETVAETQKCCEEIQRCVKDIDSIVCGSAEYWKTSSGSLLRERFAEETFSQELAQSCSELLRYLQAVAVGYQGLCNGDSSTVSLADDILG